MPTTNIAAFYTSGSVPVSGLAPLAVVRTVSPVTTVTSSYMSEVGGGWYSFPFIQYTGSVDYVITVDGGTGSFLDSRYVYAGNDSFASDVWEELSSSHQTVGTMGAVMSLVPVMSSSLEFIRNIEDGTWRIEGSQMVFYTSGTMVELARFNLQDSAGAAIDPTTDSPFRRVRV